MARTSSGVSEGVSFDDLLFVIEKSKISLRETPMAGFTDSLIIGAGPYGSFAGRPPSRRTRQFLG